MQCGIITATLLGLLCQQAVAEDSSPALKVVELLKNLKGKLVKDGKMESKAFNKYAKWCHKGARNLKLDIKSEKSDKEDQEAVIGKAKSDISSASLKIDDEASSLGEDEQSLKQAELIRKKERDEFAASQSELTESIDTLERANNVLQRKMKGSALMQTNVDRDDMKKLISSLTTVVDAASLSLHDQKKLMVLVQSSQESEDEQTLDELGAPSALAYKPHSSSILDLLEDLKQKAQKSLTELRNEERNAQHNFDMLKQSLVDQIKVAKGQMAKAKNAKHGGSQTKAGAKGDLAVVNKELSTDKGSIANLNAGCITVANEYAASVKSRADEMKTIEGAIEVLSKGFKAGSFLQIQTNQKQDGFAVVNILRNLAEKQRSSALTQLASRVSATMTMAFQRHEANPFAKVSAMIAGMVARLKKEASEEASHKAYCEKEISATKDKKEDLSSSIDEITAKMDKLKATATGLKDHAASLQKDLANLAQEQGEADQMRQEQHKAYTHSKAERKQGMKGVRMALMMLRKYYEEPKEEALIQAPEWAHKANSGTGKSVISILEMVEANLGVELSNMENEEEEQAHSYRQLSKDNKEETLVKSQTVKYKLKESTWGRKALNEHRSDLDGAQSEMDAIKEYQENIRRMCEEKGDDSYAEKKGRRESELSGLKEALKVLNGESLLQTAPRHSALRGSAVVKH